jgi:hypothetical protein
MSNATGNRNARSSRQSSQLGPGTTNKSNFPKKVFFCFVFEKVALASLANALKFGTEPEVLAAAKAVNAALQDQVCFVLMSVFLF